MDRQNLCRQQEAARLRERDLTALRWHWGTAYDFAWNGEKYTATRRDTGRVLTSQTVPWLWDLVRADYLASPIPRQL